MLGNIERGALRTGISEKKKVDRGSAQKLCFFSALKGAISCKGHYHHGPQVNFGT
jgi:hypothetical protein